MYSLCLDKFQESHFVIGEFSELSHFTSNPNVVADITIKKGRDTLISGVVLQESGVLNFSVFLCAATHTAYLLTTAEKNAMNLLQHILEIVRC